MLFLLFFFWPNVKPVYHSYSLIMAEVYHNMYLAHGLKPSNSAHQRSQPDTLAHLWQPLEGRNVCRSQLTESARRCDGNPKAAPWVVVNGACSWNQQIAAPRPVSQQPDDRVRRSTAARARWVSARSRPLSSSPSGPGFHSPRGPSLTPARSACPWCSAPRPPCPGSCSSPCGWPRRGP